MRNGDGETHHRRFCYYDHRVHDLAVAAAPRALCRSSVQGTQNPLELLVTGERNRDRPALFGVQSDLNRGPQQVSQLLFQRCQMWRPLIVDAGLIHGQNV